MIIEPNTDPRSLIPANWEELAGKATLKRVVEATGADERTVRTWERVTGHYLLRTCHKCLAPMPRETGARSYLRGLCVPCKAEEKARFQVRNTVSRQKGSLKHTRETLSADVEAFLKGGGKVEQLEGFTHKPNSPARVVFKQF